MPVRVLSAADARRLLLQGQGLLHDPARKATPAAVRKLIEHMGYVQVDTINSIERAHHHILMTRIDGYERRMLTKLLEKDRKLFEHWTHDAAVIPAAWLKYWHHPFDRFAARVRANDWWQGRMGPNAEQLAADVLQRVRDEGPLMSKDFEHKRSESSPWWGWKPSKAALEYLWFSGQLAVAGRHNFHKRYDLMERVFPGYDRNGVATVQETLDWAGKAALARMGTGSPAELREFFNAFSLPQVRQWCKEAAARGEIEVVTVEAADGSKPREQYAAPDWRKRLQRAPEPPERLRLLSPFDPVIRDRKRLKRLFDFDYAFEAFVPEKKRKYGYYVLPLLEGDRLLGRCDPKFHRDEGVLKVRKLWWESGVKPTKKRRAALEQAVDLFARQLGAERWTLPRSR